MKTCYVDMSTRVIADLAQPGELHHGWTITRINVPAKFRGRGLGSAMLDLICREADREGVVLYLDVLASGPLDNDDLKAWYSRRGFRDLGYGSMKRNPLRYAATG